MRVLIADDHPIVRQGLRLVLTSDPEMEIVGEATDGIEALELARKVAWDVAILDFAMPGRGGLELIEDMKREFPDRPVLILSIHTERLHAMRVLRAGGAGYINKSSAPQELTAAVRKVASGGKYVSSSLAEVLVADLGRDSDKPRHETLSDQEYRVMWLLASGKEVSEIAKQMQRSPSTVSTFRGRVLKKLGVSGNAELVRYCIAHKLIA